MEHEDKNEGNSIQFRRICIFLPIFDFLIDMRTMFKATVGKQCTGYIAGKFSKGNLIISEDVGLWRGWKNSRVSRVTNYISCDDDTTASRFCIFLCRTLRLNYTGLRIFSFSGVGRLTCDSVTQASFMCASLRLSRWLNAKIKMYYL